MLTSALKSGADPLGYCNDEFIEANSLLLQNIVLVNLYVLRMERIVTDCIETCQCAGHIASRLV